MLVFKVVKLLLLKRERKYLWNFFSFYSLGVIFESKTVFMSFHQKHTCSCNTNNPRSLYLSGYSNYLLQVMYKENLGTGIPTSVTPEIERVKRNQENFSSVFIHISNKKPYFPLKKIYQNNPSSFF